MYILRNLKSQILKLIIVYENMSHNLCDFIMSKLDAEDSISEEILLYLTLY